MTRRSSALTLACAALVAIASSTPPVRADDEASTEAVFTVAVLCVPGDRFGLRVQAEIEALGFRAVLLDPTTEPASRASLEEAARAAGAVAAIRAVPSERGVEVWIADRVTGKTVVRAMAGAEDALDGDGAVAMRTVDLLRASLLEVALPEPPPGEVPATAEIRAKLALPEPGALVEKPPPALRFSLAPGVLWSSGGIGAAASLDVGVAWMPSAHVGVSGFAAIPLARLRVEGAQGGADLAVLLAGVGLRFVPTPRAARWAPSVDLGAMAVSLQSDGTASAGFVARSVSAATAAPFARAGLAFAPTPMLRVRADVLVGAILQGVSIQLAASEAATWGRPIVLPSAGVDFGWF
ncbi:hypothetical protein WMF04_24040 [Sorangium sp. So ce260]|uniref:hypothetical protein n=1 Tax=Sorangium sp. So ce260 TaxID=3133291 RepID=UPI003F5E01E3